MLSKLRELNQRPIIVSLAVVLLVVICLLLPNRQEETPEQLPPGVTEGTQEPEKSLSLIDMINAAKAVKGDLLSVLYDIKVDNLEGAKTRAQTISQNVRLLRASVADAASRPSLFRKQLTAIEELLDAAQLGTDNILLPGIDLLQANPTSGLRTGGGINTRLVCTYLDFLESVMPDVEKILQCVNSHDLSLLDSEGKLTQYLPLANSLMDIYRADNGVIAALKSILGAESDRSYLLAAQNSAEIRASGGFPGSIGMLHIRDGILTLGDFSPVKTVLSYRTPQNIQITAEERVLFHQLGGIQTPWDADLCPDFPRVAHIWASSYEETHGQPVAGVISVTPHIVQRLLAVMGEELQLSDGTMLNGSNATQVLQHDLYFKYFSGKYSSANNDLADRLFAEAAQKSMEKLMEKLSLSQLMSYVSVAKDSFEDRTLMLWMKEDAEQALVTRMGWDGGLNTDPEQPEAGVFFNCVAASKMGWFLLMDTQIGAPKENPDGSRSYPVTVEFANNITQEELMSAGYYITGAGGSSICGAVYFFAPAGGTVSDFTVSNGAALRLETYNGLHLGYLEELFIPPDQPITVTYTVTTAAGVDAPLELLQTPTAQQDLLPAAE